jgi:hypothetical protein
MTDRKTNLENRIDRLEKELLELKTLLRLRESLPNKIVTRSKIRAQSSCPEKIYPPKNYHICEYGYDINCKRYHQGGLD